MPSLLRVPKKCSKNTKLRRRYFFERLGELKRSRSIRPTIPLNRRLVKLTIMENVAPGLRTFLLKHGVAELPLAKFQSLGVTYQEAHGDGRTSVGELDAVCAPAPKPAPEHALKEEVFIWKISSAAAEDQLRKLEPERRQAYAMEIVCVLTV